MTAEELVRLKHAFSDKEDDGAAVKADFLEQFNGA
jgi:hypothetical protein